MSKLYLLDCTLRDGGYVNEWNFGLDNATKIIEELQDAKLDYIECGILGSNPNGLMDNTTKFQSIMRSSIILPKKNDNCKYTIMLNYSDKDKVIIDTRKHFMVDAIRLAFFKSDYKDALEYAKELKEKGYEVFLQAMVTSQYSTDELNDLITLVNEINPYAFYLVDSFGTLYDDDILELFYIINDKLNADILLGFHAHNNMQLAMSNVMTFIQVSIVEDRDVIVDCSVYGMGRGAGNCPTELLMQYLNKKLSHSYNIIQIMQLYKKYIKPIYDITPWGYNAQYFLSARKNVSPAYIWYLFNQDITDVARINVILSLIPDDKKHYLDVNVIKFILEGNDYEQR